MFKIQCEKMTFKLELAKMKTKNKFVCFFKCSFVLRVGAVIFELRKVSMLNFVKLKFLSMTLKIERQFEEEKERTKFLFKTGQKGHEFSK